MRRVLFKGGQERLKRVGNLSTLGLQSRRLSHDRLPLWLDAISPGDDEHARFSARFAVTLEALSSYLSRARRGQSPSDRRRIAEMLFGRAIL